MIGNQQPVVIEPLQGYARATPEYWFTRVHVDHAPQLELVLPARNEVVSNDYWTELLVQCERAIYTAMAKTEPQPMLRHWDWRRAQSLGVTLQEPPARLNGWQPRKQEDRLRSHQQRGSRTTAVTRTENTRDERARRQEALGGVRGARAHRAAGDPRQGGGHDAEAAPGLLDREEPPSSRPRSRGSSPTSPRRSGRAPTSCGSACPRSGR